MHVISARSFLDCHAPGSGWPLQFLHSNLLLLIKCPEHFHKPLPWSGYASQMKPFKINSRLSGKKTSISKSHLHHLSSSLTISVSKSFIPSCAEIIHRCLGDLTKSVVSMDNYTYTNTLRQLTVRQKSQSEHVDRCWNWVFWTICSFMKRQWSSRNRRAGVTW